MLQHLIDKGRKLLEARPIPLPKKAINKTMKRLVDHLEAAFTEHEKDSPGEPLGSGIWAVADLDVTDVLGTKKAIQVMIHSTNSSGNSLGVNAHYNVRTNDIDIYIRGQIPGQLALQLLRGKGRRSIEGSIRDLLEHELTHALDNLRWDPSTYKGFFSDDYEASDEGNAAQLRDFKRYVNQRIEVNAHMQQVVSQVLVAAEKFARILTKKSPQQRVRFLLKQSDTWKAIGKYLNSRNKRRILKAVYAALS